MGAKLFKQTYAAKSMSKAKQACVAKTVPVAEAESKNASQTCRTERDANRTAFEQKYGKNENKKNAFGKCVSTTAKASIEEAAEDRAGAAETCKALKRDDAAAFAEAHGSKKNAFGRCVSATARAADDDDA
jgi:hypothetical protein